MDVYDEQTLYTEGFKAGYAQAIADADIALRKHGDDRPTRRCRQEVLALVNVPYDPLEAVPVPDWSKYSVSHPKPYPMPGAARPTPAAEGG